MGQLADALKKFAHGLEKGPWEDDLKTLGSELVADLEQIVDPGTGSEPPAEAPPEPAPPAAAPAAG
jgi:hypothetical protein